MVSIEQIVFEELEAGWQKFVPSLIKRIRKRMKVPALTTEQIQEIEVAFKAWQNKE